MPIDPRIKDAILASATQYGVSPALIAAVIQVESGFDEKALGDVNADGAPYSFGLMQLHIKGAGFGHRPRSLLNVEYNVDVGTAFLRRCSEAFPDNLDMAISAYNQGITGARDRGIINPNYVATVLAQIPVFAAKLGIEPPPATPPPPPPSQPPPPPPYEAGRTYTVQAGDTLTDIAKAQYGITDDRGAYLQALQIHKANLDVIGPNADLIQPGQTLTLP